MMLIYEESAVVGHAARTGERSTTGIAELIKSKLFTDAEVLSPALEQLFSELGRACDTRFKDYSPHWHPFYQKQLSEVIQVLASRSATIFDPNPIPGFGAYVTKSVWCKKVRPEVESAICALADKNTMTSDGQMMSDVLLNQMLFMDNAVKQASHCTVAIPPTAINHANHV